MKTSLRKDALFVCGGLYHMNASSSIGYLFNPNDKENEVSTGMFCHDESEINKDKWTFYFDFKTQRFSTIK